MRQDSGWFLFWLCDSCMRNGGTCVLKDDMAVILKMFQKADVLVLATPVYFYGICLGISLGKQK